MLDGFRFHIINNREFDTKMLNNKKLDFKSRFSVTTGEYKIYPRTAEWNEVKITLYQNSSSISGSLHKLHNNYFNGQNQNYDDFNLSKLKSIINEMKLSFGDFVENNSSVTKLEIGFNLPISISPKDFIKFRFLLYDYKPATSIKTYNGRGYVKEFEKTDFKWKVYDKTLQYKLKENILRVELKVTGIRVLRRLGIYTPNDLTNKNVIKNLFNFFITDFDNFLIVDSSENKFLTKSDNDYLIKITNPRYWLDFDENKITYRIRKKRKEMARDFIFSKKLNITHNTLKRELTNKFNLLLDT